MPKMAFIYNKNTSFVSFSFGCDNLFLKTFMEESFKNAAHTIVLSDIHLADAEPTHPKNPLWKRYKRSKFFIDRKFKEMMEFLQKEIKEFPAELVLNGDIFDFDAVVEVPKKSKPFYYSWLERKRGLHSEEPKSRFKIQLILSHHPVFLEALRNWLLSGNRLLFIIGNHDIELHWPGVQNDIINSLNLPKEVEANVRFCEWFYISNQDTLIEHGNQYDSYCVCPNPIHPLVRRQSKVFVRIPFGDVANRFMVNGMGLINPHNESSFILSAKEYFIFFYKYVVRVQPFILITWFWGATATFLFSMREGLLPALKDPLTVESRVEAIAAKSNASPHIVRTLFEIHAHPAVFSPLKVIRELWLDRAFLLFLMFLGSFQVFSIVNVFVSISIGWFFLLFFILIPLFLNYARSVKPEIYEVQRAGIKLIDLASQISKVKRTIHGHTHHELHINYKGVEHINTGSWSPSFRDPECTQPFGRRCFAWIKPNPDGSGRVAELYRWRSDQTAEKIQEEPYKE